MCARWKEGGVNITQFRMAVFKIYIRIQPLMQGKGVKQIL